MEIRQERFIDFLGREQTSFTIPVFQRVYSWDARQCEELWEDVMDAGASGAGDGQAHFMGMVLCSADSETWGGANRLDIIDGQQRLTTLTLMLCAFARYLDETDGAIAGLSADALRQRYLLTGDGANASGKLALSFMDRETLFALVGAGSMPDQPAGRLIDNLELFFGNMQQEGFDAERFWRGVERLEIASVLLSHDDSPQLVFESLNSKGMALSTADRMRNFIVVNDEAQGHAEGGVFERCWLPLERLVAQLDLGIDVSGVVHAWLAGAYRDTRIHDKAQVYGLFKSRLRSEYDGDIEKLLSDVAAYARRLGDDEAFREEQLADAERWIAGKPKDLISEYKMFGD